MLQVPHGLDEIKEIYGDPFPLIQDDGIVSPIWERAVLDTAMLPAPLSLGWNLDIEVQRIRGHKLALPSLIEVLQAVWDADLWYLLRTFDGCYNWRSKRGQAKLSTHSWGIAVDLNASTNQFRTCGDMDQRIVDEFEGRGWVWGGRWPAHYRDAMHFQRCSGF